MSYIYEDYAVEETRKAYLVSELWNETKVRIEKKLIESLNLEEEPEMLAIIMAKLEFIRIDSKCLNSRAQKSIIRKKEFLQNFKSFVEKGYSLEDILAEVSEMKYHETKEYFIKDVNEDLR